MRDFSAESAILSYRQARWLWEAVYWNSKVSANRLKSFDANHKRSSNKDFDIVAAPHASDAKGYSTSELAATLNQCLSLLDKWGIDWIEGVKTLRWSLARLKASGISAGSSIVVSVRTFHDLLDAVLACKLCQCVVVDFAATQKMSEPSTCIRNLQLPNNLIIFHDGKCISPSLANGLHHLHSPKIHADKLIKDIRDRHLNKPWLTVVIPTLGERNIEDTLRSLAEQTATDYEVLVISADTSGETFTEEQPVTGSLGNAIQYRYHAADKNVYDAMNLGLALAAGRWIYFLGDDDTLADAGALNRVRSAASQPENQTSLIFGLVKMIGAGPGTYDGQIWRYGVDYDSLRDTPISHQACFYRTALVTKAGGFNTKYQVCADWDLNLRLWNQANPMFVDYVLCRFRRGGLSSTTVDIEFLNDIEQIWGQNHG